MALQTDYELTQDQAIQYEGANEMLMLTVQELSGGARWAAIILILK